MLNFKLIGTFGVVFMCMFGAGYAYTSYLQTQNEKLKLELKQKTDEYNKLSDANTKNLSTIVELNASFHAQLDAVENLHKSNKARAQEIARLKDYLDEKNDGNMAHGLRTSVEYVITRLREQNTSSSNTDHKTARSQ